jgi:hypothetical protein
MRTLAALWGTPDAHRLTLARLNAAATAPVGQRHYYDLMEAYYQNNALYDWLARFTREEGVKQEALKGIRTPARRITAFYHSLLWPGDLDAAFPLEFPEGAAAGLVEDGLRRVWEWSNWATEKDVAALWLAQHGDLFLRVAQPPARDSVYLERVRPQYVTDVRCERGLVKEIRLDVPLADDAPYPPPAQTQEDRWHTEHWSKADGAYRLWVHRNGPDTPLADLGAPTDALPLEAFGVDFVPFVQAKFEDRGEQRGASCFEGGLDKFDELNRKATRHSQLMFNHNHPDWSLERAGADATGRPVPAPKVTDEDGLVVIGDERFFRVPAGWTLKQLVAALDYKAYLDTVESEEAALAADFPEMIWSRLSGATELSGRALEKLLAPAVARCERARTAADRALQRAHMLALSVVAASGLFPGLSPEDYDAGRLAHTFKPRPVLPEDGLDDAQGELAEADADLKQKALGIPLRYLLRKRGWDEADIAAIEREAAQREAEAQRLAQQQAQRAPAPVDGVRNSANGQTNGRAR